jgi:2-(1,2-epoxy-1,2-dihydrophenyl)acetyl-CoA isomerase
VIVRGTGGVFCSGRISSTCATGPQHDFGYLRPDGTAAPPGYGESFKEILEYLHSAISEFKRAPKPFIAAVDGSAAAGGFGIAMACDLVYASERSIFEWAYHKTALTGAESSTFFLPRLVGLRRALELMLRNPRLTARQARELGLITDVFPTASFEADVLAVALELACGPTRAFAVSKSLLHRAAAAEQLDYHLDQELEELVRVADGPEFAEGLKAFLDKRQPVWRC